MYFFGYSASRWQLADPEVDSGGCGWHYQGHQQSVLPCWPGSAGLQVRGGPKSLWMSQRSQALHDNLDSISMGCRLPLRFLCMSFLMFGDQNELHMFMQWCMFVTSFFSEPQGMCYIETSNLDGETNLKIRQVIFDISLSLNHRGPVLYRDLKANRETNLKIRHVIFYKRISQKEPKM